MVERTTSGICVRSIAHVTAGVAKPLDTKTLLRGLGLTDAQCKELRRRLVARYGGAGVDA